MNSAPYSGAATRRSALHFLGGKAASGAITFVLLLWLVRVLPVHEYGVYVTLVAGVELGIPIAALGLYWKAARFIPEFRLNAPAARLIALAWRLWRMQALALAACSLVALVTMDTWLASLHLLAHREAALLMLALLLTEGMGRFTRECLLGPMLQQAAAQASLVSRGLVHLALLGLLVAAGRLSLTSIMLAELLASSLALAVALGGLLRVLKGLASLPGRADWTEPDGKHMWRLALQMYLSHLLTLLYSPQAFTVVLQKSLGAEAVAVFGFLRTLHDQLARYLPASLLFSVIRPKLVASFVGGGGIRELAANANLVGKLSLFVLMPFVIAAAVEGQALVDMLSGGKFAQTGWLLLGFMVALLPYSQRQLLETVAVASGHSAWCLPAAASGVLMLPLMLGMLTLGLGLWAPVAALCLGHLLFNAIVVLGMARSEGYRADALGAAKLLLAAALAWLAAGLVSRAPNGLDHAAVRIATAMLSYWVAAWWLKPFGSVERERLNRSLPRRLFVW